MIPRQKHRAWPIRAAGQVRIVKQETVLIAPSKSDLGCPSAQSIADPQKSARSAVKEAGPSVS